MARPELILKTIEKNPGIRFREIMDELELKNGTLSHHLQKLERESVLRAERTPVSYTHLTLPTIYSV